MFQTDGPVLQNDLSPNVFVYKRGDEGSGSGYKL